MEHSPSSRRLNAFALGVVVFAGMVLCSTAAAATLSFDEGIARDPGDGRMLYREQHWIRRDGDTPRERLVIYRCADGTAFARKHVDYRSSRIAPAFALEDARDGYREGVRQASAPVAFVRDSRAAQERSAPLAAAALVADAGFDEFIRRQWPRLQAGEAVALRFAVPARLDSYGFTLRRIGAATVAGEPASIFRLRLGGWLAWLAPHVDVAYGQDSRRLLRFEGPSNLRDDAGRAQLRVRIDFPDPPRPASEADWQAAATTALSACKVGQ